MIIQTPTKLQGIKSLHFLPSKSRATLSSLGHFIDTKLSRLKQDSSVETTWFRQAVYINWTKNMLIPVSCGPESGYEFVLACFLELLMNCHNSRSATIRGYTESINTFFQLRDFPIPGNFSDRENACSRIITVWEREEDIARQRSPITKEMFVAMANKAKSLDKDPIKSVVFNGFCFIRIAELWVAEYAQTTAVPSALRSEKSRGLSLWITKQGLGIPA